MNKHAVLSPDRRHRFMLKRSWSDQGACNFIGLNPSTADETEDDPTIRRCIAFAKRFGCGSLVMTNLFSLRATDPKEMKLEAMPNVAFSTGWIKEEAKDAAIVVAAWGTHGDHLIRDKHIYEMLRANGIQIDCLGVTKEGFPKHPLYLKADSDLRIYSGRNK